LFRIGYTVTTYVAQYILPVAALISPKLKDFLHQRKHAKPPLKGPVKFWIHAASLGEYEMALPLLAKLLPNGNLEDILITIFSPSGYTQAIKGKYASRLMYLPLDTAANVSQFYHDYAPQKAIFIRYDFWFHFINEGQKRGVEFYLVNGRFRPNHFVFAWHGKPYLQLFKRFKGIFTSDTKSAILLKDNGVAAAYLGDTRFDRVDAIAQTAKRYVDIEQFKGNRKLLMVGSQKAIFIRYDFWFHFINEGQKRGVEFYLVNGRFRPNHFVFAWHGKPYLQLLKRFKGIFTSDTKSAILLKDNGVAAAYLGDTRFDRVDAIAQTAKRYVDIEQFKGNRKLLMVGSSWEAEELLTAQLLARKLDNLAIVIAPHDLKRANEIAHKLHEFSPKKYTEGVFNASDQVLILDTMGMLSSMYQYADFALIGGGFSGALHNILEPAIWGCYLSFGPKISKFPEAQEFVDQGFAMVINSDETWVKQLSHLLSNPKECAYLKQKATDYCASQLGSTARIVNLMSKPV